MVRLRGKQIAPRARHWLTSASKPGIHSLYHQSVNLMDPQNGLLSVVLPDLGPGPFTIVAAPAEESFVGFGSLELNTPVAIKSTELQIGNIRIDTSGVRDWQPRPNWRLLGDQLDEKRISHMADLLSVHAPPNSFAPLATDQGRQPDQSFHSEALHAAADPAARIRSALAAGDSLQAVSAAGQLAGLGGGVTPSGDDYLQGAMHALWLKLDEGSAQRLCTAIVEVAAPRTNAISREWLKAAARGEAGADWHLLAQALSSKQDFDAVFIRLVHRGHTSGADALSGFLSLLQRML